MAVAWKQIIWVLLASSLATGRKVVVLDDNEWDSVVVTTSPVKITNSRFNPKNSTKDHAIRFTNRVKSRSLKCQTNDLKCLYDNQLMENQPQTNQDTIKKFLEQYASMTNVKFNQDLRNASMKSYWNKINAEKHKHPFDDTKGWITLDPIPWSSSHVAKWRPHNEEEARPWHNKPSHSAQFWVNNVQRPSGAVVPSAQWGIGSNDIITDNKPSGFPINDFHSQSMPFPSQTPYSSTPDESPQGYQRPTPPPQYQPQVPVPQPATHYPAVTQSSPNHFSWQSGYNKFPSGISNNHGMPDGHPDSYPSENNGEWVLLSTTKGYSIPQRYHDRKIDVKQALDELSVNRPEIVSRSFKSRYQENDLDDNFSSHSKANENPQRAPDVARHKVWNVDRVNILHTEHSERRNDRAFDDDGAEHKYPSETTFKRTVRLTVLPPISNTSTTSHDGLLEVDANQQTVDEAQQEEQRLKKLQKLAVVTTGRHPYQLVPIVHNSENQDMQTKRAAIMAAVGAGMIPATMAVLLPVALGRRRRSVRADVNNIERLLASPR